MRLEWCRVVGVNWCLWGSNCGCGGGRGGWCDGVSLSPDKEEGEEGMQQKFLRKFESVNISLAILECQQRVKTCM